MLITYTHKFVVVCPANQRPITYELTIQSARMIHVEKIIIACQVWREQFHERLAEHLAYQFPGTQQTLIADHHGVLIRTDTGALIKADTGG